MNTLQTQIENLQRVAHELLFLGMDDTPIYTDRFSQLNVDVFRQTNELFRFKGASLEEEASLCLALLTGYNATIYSRLNKEKQMQQLLDRCWPVLEQLPASLLKCQLLIRCYSEVFEEDLAAEAHDIINTWTGRALTETEREAVEELESLENNPYPHSYVEE